MQKLFHFFRKHKIVCCLVVLVLISLPFIIDLIYILGDKYLPFYFPTGYEPSDWLSFYGSLLSFGGTVGLGILALYQNKKLTDINENMFLEQQRNIKRPNFTLFNIYSPAKCGGTDLFKCDDYWEFTCYQEQVSKTPELQITLRNIGEGKAQRITINGQHSLESLFGRLSDTDVGKCIDFIANIDHRYLDNPRTIELVYENSTGCLFCQSFTYVIIEEDERKYRVRVNRMSRQYFKPKLANKEIRYEL